MKEAELSMEQRLGGSERTTLAIQSNLATSYNMLGRHEKALSMERDIYSGRLKLQGEENKYTLEAANNYANSLLSLRRFEEAKSLMCKVRPVAQRVLGESDDLTLMMRQNYARALHKDPDATLDDLREAVTMLEETALTARRVLGSAHPLAMSIETSLRIARAALGARETPSGSA